MRRSVSIAVSVSSALALVGAVAASSGGASAAASHPAADLAVSGFVAGAERSVESSHPVVFVFDLTNRGPATVDSSADLSYTSVTNGTVTDQLCVFSSGNSFNPDSPYCEYGALARGQVAHMTLIIQPRSDVTGVRLSVRVCSSNESGIPDPVASNDCVTRSVGL